MVVIMMDEKEKNILKGREAEFNFRKWLDKHNIPYLYIQQDTETFSLAFKKLFLGKRPDFMILVPNFGLMFVDVKYRKINPEYKSYPLDSEETKNILLYKEDLIYRFGTLFQMKI